MRDHRNIRVQGILLLLVGVSVVGMSLDPLYGFAILAVVIAIVLVAWPLSASTVAITTILLVLSPDSPNIVNVYHLQVTPRILALVLVLLQWIIAVCRARVRVRLTFAVAWGVYLVAVVIGAIVADRLQAVPLFLLLVILPYGAGCAFGEDTELLRGVLRGIIVGSCILSVIAITEFIRHKAFISPVYGITEYARAGNLRANAGWQHPLALGMFLCLGAFVVIDKAWRRGFIYAAAAVLLITGAVFATQERSPLIGLVTGALVFVLLQVDVRKRAGMLIIIGVAVLGVFAIPGSSGTAFRQFLSQSTVAGTTAAADVTGRSELLRLGVHAVTTRPVFGFGYGVGTSVGANARLAPLLTSRFVTYTDIANWPLTIAIETGLLGLAAFVVIVGGNLARMFRRRSTIYPLPVVPAVAGLVAALVTSFGVATLPSSLLFIFVMGVYSTGCEVSDPSVAQVQVTSASV